MKKQYQNIIVTGGSGFIGSHLVDALIPLAEKVIVIDKVKAPKQRKNAAAKYKVKNIQDKDIEKIFKSVKPDVVFHLAAHIHDRESVHEPVSNAMDNVIGTINVLEAARKYAKRVVFASTSVVYGHQKTLPTPENAELRPLTPYAISKLTGERYLHFYHQVYQLPYMALRLGNVYGPRQDASAESGAIGIFASRFLRGEQVYVNNDGKTTRDYVFVDDVVHAMLLAAESDTVGVCNIASGEETSTIEILEAVRASVGVQAKGEAREEIQDVVKHIALDIKLAKKMLSWAPSITLQEGIEKTVDWYKAQI